MSSHDQGKADGGGGGPPPVVPVATKKPSKDEIMNKLMEFQRQHPEIEVTTEGFAAALRKVAMRKQAAEMMKDMTGASVEITPPQLSHDNTENAEPNTVSSTNHGSTTQEASAEDPKSAVHGSSVIVPTTSKETDQTGLGAHQMAQSSQAISIKDKDGQQLGFWMKTEDVHRIVHTPNGSSFKLAIKASSALPTVNVPESAGLANPASSKPGVASAHKPKQSPLSIRSKEDSTGPSSAPASIPTVVVTPAAAPAPAADAAAAPPTATAQAAASSLAPTSSLDPAPVLNRIQGFAAASGATGTRKAPPPALNLAGPSKTALKPAPTHYISMPAQSRKMMPPEGMDRLEKALNWGKSQSERIVLLRSPIKMMMPDNKEKDAEAPESTPIVGDYHLKPIPGASQKAIGLSTDSTFTLETPLTAKFAKEQVELENKEKTKNDGSASVFQPDIKALLKELRSASDKIKKQNEASSETKEGNEVDSKGKGKGNEVVSKTKEKKTKKAHPTHRRSGKGIPRFRRLHLALKTGHSRISMRFDMIEGLCMQSETMVNVCKYLPPEDILTLYSVHRTFHSSINNMLRSSTLIWTNYNCPEAAMVYNWHSLEYRHLTMPDPFGRPQESPLTPTGFRAYRPPQEKEYKPEAANDDDISSCKDKEKAESDAQNDDEQVHVDICLVPMIKWYAMCYKRQEAVEDILAHLARRGHRTPPGTLISLLKLWKLMETPSNAGRRNIIQNAARSSQNVNCRCYILEAKRALDAGRAVLPLKTLEMMARIGVSDLPEAVMGFTDMDLLRLQCFFLKLDLPSCPCASCSSASGTTPSTK
ncbi:histidine kinase group protein [Apiospora arundinis]|uniref:Histidine kinase group protein n=1 Tax=Apiospora arundinis TaxID=335852 RepID=A0ABR2I4D8_9PEZI